MSSPTKRSKVAAALSQIPRRHVTQAIRALHFWGQNALACTLIVCVPCFPRVRGRVAEMSSVSPTSGGRTGLAGGFLFLVLGVCLFVLVLQFPVIY